MNDEKAQPKSDESRVMARRYFIRATIYAAPVVAGVVAVQHASAQASFCAANCNQGSQCGSGACIACAGIPPC